ncbi:uncharacterized protein BDW47DRAFT_100415 [Aspergillus candidus]|uniref:Uncharacterized protein n=1 Tax=Aspergillus candidus TaxID=41067 RepID=A0A2I2FK85_ASPCN|nr:hypothetical protein BDW47DRAFT_100415 [Aspergillus candidus]PLB41047.1 hypothetical protein BDW47DRAFT_100415 [Aspergillus candidus]
MFEDFSFSSPSSTRPPRLAIDSDDRLMVDCDTTLISPMSSRCPSPRTCNPPATASHRFPRSLSRARSLQFHRSPQQAPTSVPLSAYENFLHNKRLSITTLTQKLHEHSLHSQSTSPSPRPADCPMDTPPQSATSDSFPGYVLTPPDTEHGDNTDDDLDEGFFDSFPPPGAQRPPSPSSSPFLSPTSAPAADSILLPPVDPQPAGSDHPQPAPDSWSIRSQRQHISRMQCNPSTIDAMRRAVLTEPSPSYFPPTWSFPDTTTTTINTNINTNTLNDDCHPSSLPPQQSPRRRASTLHRHTSRFRPSPPSTASESCDSSSSRNRRKSSPISALAAQSHGGSRIEKNYHHASSAEMRKKSEQGLRRKSLVSAALASMVENMPIE